MSEAPTVSIVERLLRTIWGRALLVFLVVLVGSLGMSVPRFEIMESFGIEPDRWSIFSTEVLRWSAWAALAWPIAAFARWTLAKSGSWLVLLLAQLPISVGVGYAFLELDYAMRLDVPARVQHSLTPGPPAGGEARGRRGPGPGLGRPGNGRGGDWRGGRDRPNDRGADREVDREGERGLERAEERLDGRNSERPGPRGRGRFEEGPDPTSPFWQFRWMQLTLLYWVVLGMGAGVRSFLDASDRKRHVAEMELRAERLRAQLARAQLDSLTSQLNPHFLFNALHSVGGLVRAGQEQAALKTLAAIGELLRATLDQGELEEVPLSRELEIAERYLDIERIRLGDRLTVNFDIPAELGAALVPSLLLLPLVENAVRHGISDLPEGGSVSVRVHRRGPSLEIEVSDSGNGFPSCVLESGQAEPNDERRSIGLENTRSRMLALYDQNQQFQLGATESGGARVTLIIPYHEETLTGESHA